jgi:DNA-binding LytR/AlgR family response regulator
MNAAPPRAILADDEELPRADLRRMLEAAWPGLDIVAECEHGPAAVQAIAELAPQVAFLDIRMPGLSGLEVAATAARAGCHAVFTTAYDSHAVEAFAAGAIDYLLKPVAAERLAQTVDRLRTRLAAAEPASAIDTVLSRLAAQLAPAAPRLKWLSASVGDTIKLFSIDEVLFFQSDEKYTRVVCAHDEAHVRKPLKEIAAGLDTEAFWQVHRGVIVRAERIARAQRDELGRIVLHLRGHRETLPVSQAYAWRFRPM